MSNNFKRVNLKAVFFKNDSITNPWPMSQMLIFKRLIMENYWGSFFIEKYHQRFWKNMYFMYTIYDIWNVIPRFENHWSENNILLWCTNNSNATFVLHLGSGKPPQIFSAVQTAICQIALRPPPLFKEMVALWQLFLPLNIWQRKGSNIILRCYCDRYHGS